MTDPARKEKPTIPVLDGQDYFVLIRFNRITNQIEVKFADHLGMTLFDAESAMIQGLEGLRKVHVQYLQSQADIVPAKSFNMNRQN